MWVGGCHLCVGGDKTDTDPKVRHIPTSYDDDDDDDQKRLFQLHQCFKCFSQRTSSPPDAHNTEDEDFDGMYDDNEDYDNDENDDDDEDGGEDDVLKFLFVIETK